MVNGDRSALLDLVACPNCGESLAWEGNALTCTGRGHRFPAVDSVPELYPDAGTGGHDRTGVLGSVKHFLLARPLVYEFVQRHLGGGDTAPPVVRELERSAGKIVLDLGAGTGTLAEHLPTTARYVWLENDSLKLRGLAARAVDCLAVLGDASKLPFPDASVDMVTTVDVSHHLPDDVFARFLDEAARVTRETFIFVDAVKTPRLTSRVLWAGDLGRHPRREDEILVALRRRFDVEHVERFRIHHDYVLCRCRPRGTE